MGYVFGELLREFRARAGLTQLELANKLQVSRTTINAWEHSKYLPRYREDVLRLAEALDLSNTDTDALLIAAQYPPEYPIPLGVGETDYDVGVILQLLTTAFDSVDLWYLCRETELLQPICQRVKHNAPINYIAYRVIEYCMQHDILGELLQTVHSVREQQFERFQQYLKPSSDHAWLVTRDREGARIKDLLFELSEWKLVHNESQSLVNTLGVSLDFLRACRLRPENTNLDFAGFQWRELCVPMLRHVPDKWNLEYAYSPEFDTLREQASNLDDITHQLMGMDAKGGEFVSLYSRLTELRDTLWGVLTIADKSIKALVEHLSHIIGE
jgi:transcriptional regulator with XRE-family HTH domain